MPTYILIKAQDGWNTDDPMTWMAGYPVDVYPRSSIGGTRLIPPRYVQVEITDDDDFQAIKQIYCGGWLRQIDWEFVGHDYGIDGHRLRVFTKSEHVSVSGLNSLTREQVESFLNRWNATVVSTAANSVTFDAIILDAIKSSGFWERDVSMVGFTEKGYDAATGIHRVEADYSASDFSSVPQQTIEKLITSKGGTVTKHLPGRVTFDIGRASVFDVFKQDVKEKVDGQYSRRRFKILPQHIQMAIDAGGTLSVTRTQFAQYVYNRLND